MLRADLSHGSPTGDGPCTLREGVVSSFRQPVAELERCLALAAYLVVRHGDVYVPTFERLEYEVEQRRRQLGNRERAQRVLAELMKNGVGHAGVLSKPSR